MTLGVTIGSGLGVLALIVIVCEIIKCRRRAHNKRTADSLIEELQHDLDNNYGKRIVDSEDNM